MTNDATSSLSTEDAAPLEAVLRSVHGHREQWALTPVERRRTYLQRVVHDTMNAAPRWNAAACRAKGIDRDGPGAGEELLAGIASFVRMATTLEASLSDIAISGRPRYPGPVRHVGGEQLAIGVLPSSLLDKVLYSGLHGEVWFAKGLDEAAIQARQAEAYRDPVAHAGLSLILGAGNVASLVPRDILTKLFVEGKVVVIKANPVNDYLVPFWEEAFAGLIDAGFVHFVRGGAAEGAYLASHDFVDDIHITGSSATYDAVVWGGGDEAEARKERGEPRLTTPVSAELGNVSPIIIVPGTWTKRELAYQAAHVATMLVNNAGFNCLTPRVLVTHRAWPQRDEFLAALGEVLANVPSREAYYPGARDRWSRFTNDRDDVRLFGDDDGSRLPWTLVAGVDPANHDDIVFQVEAFCSLMAETSLDADSTADFIVSAVDFCNDVLWGTLSATVLVDPRTAKEAPVAAAIDHALAALRYGSVGLNAWHALSFLAGTTTWGAYPGHPATDIRSGVGVVANTFMFADVEKSVVRGPFVAVPTPPWFVTKSRGATAIRRLLDVQGGRGWRGVPGLLWATLRA
jgi:acyl-CoA reductase-like NAD-dependent aldehyde dehydrogenase